MTEVIESPSAETEIPDLSGVARPTVEMKDFKFRFKKDKLENQRPNVELKLGVPNLDGIVKILENGGKGFELLQDAMYDVIRAAALEKVNADEKITGQDSFPYAEVSWEAIANQDRADRRSSTIPEDTWKAFVEDYTTIMPALTGKSPEAVTNATIVYLKKFAQVKTDKKSLGKLKEQLVLYTSNTKKGEDFTEILELLNRKVDNYLKDDETAQLVANL